MHEQHQTSVLSARLKLVQAQPAGAIDHVPAGLVRALSASWRRAARSLSMLT